MNRYHLLITSRVNINNKSVIMTEDMRAKSTNRASAMVEASDFSRMARCSMKVISRLAWRMAEAGRYQLAAKSIMVNGRMEKDTASANTQGLKINAMTASGI